MGMSDLIANATSSKPRKLPDKLRKKIEADLKQVVAAENDGRAVPGAETITRFFETEYELKVSKHTTNKWLRAIREGRPIQ